LALRSSKDAIFMTITVHSNGYFFYGSAYVVFFVLFCFFVVVFFFLVWKTSKKEFVYGTGCFIFKSKQKRKNTDRKKRTTRKRCHLMTSIV